MESLRLRLRRTEREKRRAAPARITSQQPYDPQKYRLIHSFRIIYPHLIYSDEKIAS